MSIDDQSAEAALIDQVERARAERTPLAIRGGASKAFYGNPAPAEQVLDCSVHRGVLAYEPTELAITLRAGTPLSAVEALLAESGQQFPFEPPHFGPTATVGGMVAAGLSGPRRPYAASVRDAVLGVRLLNGQGQALTFGGRVMKNVAGYDLSRLMAGSLGVLAVLLEVSLKVAPRAPASLTLVQEQPLPAALECCKQWLGAALPISASAWVDGRLYLRLCTSEAGLAAARAQIGGEPLAAADRFWADLREQRLAFFAGSEPLWRLSVRPATPVSLPAIALETGDVLADAAQLVEWHGAVRWLRGDLPAAPLRAWAQAAGGHATLFRAGDGDGAATASSAGVFTPPDPLVLHLHRRLKQAFDPDRLFNPGRLFPDL